MRYFIFFIMTCLSSSGSAGVHSAVARSMVEHLREKVQFFEEQMRDSFETKIQNYEQNQIKNDPKLLEKLQHQKSEILERIHLIESAIRKLEQAQIELKKLKENLALAQTNFSGQVAHLNQENKKLAQSIENIMFQFLSNVEIVQKIGLEHDSLLAEIQSGNHPVLKEIETLLFDLEKFAHEKVKELNFEILSFNQEANAFNEESASDSYHIQDLEVRISRYYEDYQNAANSVNRARQDRYEKGIQRYEFIHDNYSPAEKFLEEDDDEKVESIVNVIKKELNAEQFAEELKNSFDLKKQEFEIEYQKYLESKKRIDSCIQEKLIYFDQKRSELESYQKRVEEQLNEQKVLVDQQINLLDQTLESQLSSLSNQHQEMHLDLVSKFGINYQSFCDIYGQWTSKQANEEQVVEAFEKFPPFSIGENGRVLINLIKQMRNLKRSFLDSKQNIINNKKNIKKLEEELNAAHNKKNTLNELRRDLHEVEQKQRSLKIKIDSSQDQIVQDVNILRKILDICFRLHKIEFEILSYVISSKPIPHPELSSNLDDYQNHCSKLLDATSQLSENIHVKNFIDQEKLIEKQFVFSSDAAGSVGFQAIIFGHQRPIDTKMELRDISKRAVISRWYQILSQRTVLFDCSALSSIYYEGIDQNWETFTKALFQEAIYEKSNLYQVNFQNQIRGYQVVLGGESYWIQPDGCLEDIHEFTRNERIAAEDLPLIPSYPEDVVLIGKTLGEIALKGVAKKVGLMTEKAAGQAVCFPGNTLICTDQFQHEIGTQTISSIFPGSFVESCSSNSLDISNFYNESQKVVHTFKTATDHLIQVFFEDDFLETTEDHPFYVVGKGWIPAKKLESNDFLWSIQGKQVAVQHIGEKFKTVEVYNLEVEKNNNYFASGILVHNCNESAGIAKEFLQSGSQAIASTEKMASCDATGYAMIETPHGLVFQDAQKKALLAREEVLQGKTVYRIGTRLESNTGREAQFWSLEHPARVKNFAERYGLPKKNAESPNFIETGVVKKDAHFLTRQAPAVGNHPGGSIEVVVPKDSNFVEVKSHVSL